MTDISVTASSVVARGARVVNGTAAASITAGQVVYKEAATGKFNLSDSNSGTAEAKTAYGVALNGAAAGQPLAVAPHGDVEFNSVLTAGEAYYLSATPGGIQPSADLGSEDVVFLGLAKSTTVLALNIQAPGVTLA